MITVPDRLRAKASTDPDRRAWLTGLPALCDLLSQRWGVRIAQPYADGHVSLVLPGDRAGTPVVIKIAMPGGIDLGTIPARARADEGRALRLWAGDGAVRLLDSDPESGALLLEQCRPGLPLDQAVDPRAAERVALDLLGRLHAHPVPTGFDRLSDRVGELAADLPERFERTKARFDPRLIDAAVAVAGDLAAADSPEVLLHGDFQHANVLTAERQPYLAIDPLPMVGEPGYDAVQYLLFAKGDLDDPETQWRPVISRFCRSLGVDPGRVMGWIYVRLVSDALAAVAEGIEISTLEARQGDLWTARLVG